MSELYMPNIYINEQTVVIKKSGITYALKDLIKSMPKAIVSDNKITAEEWDKTIDKLIEINTNREEDSKIFKGSEDKDSKNFMLVMPGQEINFSSDEMRELYETMGISFEKSGDDIPECVIEMPDISNFKRIADSIHNVTLKSLGAIKDTLLNKDSSKVDSAELAKTKKNVQPKTSSKPAPAGYDDEVTKENNLCKGILIASSVIVPTILGIIFHRKIKLPNQKGLIIKRVDLKEVLHNRNSQGVLRPLQGDLDDVWKSNRYTHDDVYLSPEFLRKHPPIQNSAPPKKLFDKLSNKLYEMFFG